MFLDVGRKPENLVENRGPGAVRQQRYPLHQCATWLYSTNANGIKLPKLFYLSVVAHAVNFKVDMLLQTYKQLNSNSKYSLISPLLVIT